jgi:hypothetical protein
MAAMHATPIGGAPLLEALAGRFTDLVTIYTGTETITKGDVVQAHASARAGHSNIPAIVSPGNVGNARMKREEMMASGVTTEMEYIYVQLSGAWPLIDLQDSLLVVSTGLYWSIVAHDVDQTQTFTKLYCERLAPGNV